MRLLIDENLPATLADLLPVESYHATRFGRNPSDQELWKAAREQDLVILTRDTDFFDRLMIEGPPPKVVWKWCWSKCGPGSKDFLRMPI